MPSLWKLARRSPRAHRRLLRRAARAGGLERVHARHDDRRPPRRRRDGRGRGRHLHAADHDDFPDGEMLAGTWSLHDYSVRLDDLELFAAEPQMGASRDYRRWAFESAALDLALRQAGRSFADARRTRVPAGALRRVDARRHRAVPRAVSGARVQARRRRGLGPRADGAARCHRPRARPRSEGVLPQHVRRSRARSGALRASSPSAFPAS